MEFLAGTCSSTTAACMEDSGVSKASETKTKNFLAKILKEWKLSNER